MSHPNRTSRLNPCLRALMILAICLGPGSVLAQSLTIEPLLNAHNIQALLEVEGKVLAGLELGGLVVFEADDPDSYTRILAGEGLSGNQVADMVWTGRHVWVATHDGGLTRIGDVGGQLSFRQYASNLGGIDLTAVTGTVIGGSERVFYAMNGAGIGVVTDGLPGNLYTAEQDGLIDNTVNALLFYQGDLFVGTPSGISRFADNVFTDQNTGLTDTQINTLVLADDGSLLAGGTGGVYRWDDGSEAWSLLPGSAFQVRRLVNGPAGLFALGVNNLRQYDGAAWNGVSLPYPRTAAAVSGRDLWVGGRINESGTAGSVGLAWLGRRQDGGGFATWSLEASLVLNATGITLGLDGSPWIGSHNANAVSHLTDSGWSGITRLATAENDSSGLFNFYANILSMTTGTDGMIYVGQYTSGVVRHDPVSGQSELMFPNNCGLRGRNIINMVTHPDGPIFFLHDWADADKVEVLVDTDNWRNPDNWVIPPTGEGGLGTGPTVFDVLVESRDVIWFAVEGTGLVRWDINGDIYGPDENLTWLDTSDDRWDAPISTFSGSSNDPKQAESLALAPDGSIWVGGNGVVRFTYDRFQRETTVVEQFGEKTSPFAEGLINGNVSDLCVDGDGTLWVATRSGLNRGITSEGETAFTAWFDLGNYLSNSTYGTLYSPDAIVKLPGGLYRRILAAPQGDRMLLATDRGAALLVPGPGSGDADPVGGLASVYLYPNPFRPGEGEGLLKIGGIDADAVNGDPATVEVYNVEGQLVYDNSYVSAGVGFWDGRNLALERNDTATGMYVVRIMYKGQTAVQPLALVR